MILLETPGNVIIQGQIYGGRVSGDFTIKDLRINGGTVTAIYLDAINFLKVENVEFGTTSDYYSKRSIA